MRDRVATHDIISEIIQHIDRIDRKLYKMVNRKNLTYPRMPVENIPEELVDGQLIVADDDQVYSYRRDVGVQNANTA